MALKSTQLSALEITQPRGRRDTAKHFTMSDSARNQGRPPDREVVWHR
jgi:hypothetical protein